MWKIGGEGARAARYPEIGMSSLARNFLPIGASYLLIHSNILFSLDFVSLPPFLLFPFSHFLLAIDTCVLVPPSLSLSPSLPPPSTSVIFFLSFNEIIRPFA